jgi:hypothetical protein
MNRQTTVLPSLFMAKFKAARGRSKAAPGRPPAAVSCVVLVLVGMALVMIFLYEVIKHANG